MNSTLVNILIVGAVFAAVLILIVVKKNINKQHAEESERRKIIELGREIQLVAQQRHRLDLSQEGSDEYQQLLKKELVLTSELKLLYPNKTGTFEPGDTYINILKQRLKPRHS